MISSVDPNLWEQFDHGLQLLLFGQYSLDKSPSETNIFFFVYL